MFGRHKYENVENNGSEPFGWPRSERARRRLREMAAAERIDELRWQWRSACSNTSLAQMIYTPSGATKSIPMIGQSDLGPPVSFTVKMRPGQTIDDFVRAAPLIAPTMDVAELQVVPSVPHWVRIVLLPTPLMAMPA